jgi:hypothetical protein
MRRPISLLVVAAALVALPISTMLRRNDQKKILARLKQLGWGMGEDFKIYDFS